MSIDSDGTVRHEVVVDLPQEQAFRAFADLDRIKPREHNLLAVPIAATVPEQRAGGDVCDRGVDGSTRRWGRLLAFDPHNAIAFTSDIGLDRQVTTDLRRSSEIEATFVAEAEHQTRMRLVHRHIENHGLGWESLPDGVDAPDGWTLYPARYQAMTRGEEVST